jgi:hypothetical protein
MNDKPYDTGVDTRKSGDELIAEERMDQVINKGHTILMDIANNGNNELIMMADALIHHKYSMAPDNWDRGVVEHMMGKTYVQRLVIAGALIAAEIDRLNLQSKIQENERKIANANGQCTN